MDNNNNFLSSYNKKNDSQKEKLDKKIPVKTMTVSTQKYEEKSGFKKPQKQDGRLRITTKSKTKIIVPIVIGVVVILGIIIGGIALLNGGIEVKDFTDWTVNDIQFWARDNGVILQVEEVYNDEFDANKVISQDAAEGTKVKKGDFIKVTVSLGHDLSVLLPLPDLMSMTKVEVEAWADENYMTKVRITTEYNNEVVSGKVIRYEINDNTVVSEVKRDTPVYVIVSKGAEDETAILVTVPDFKTMPLSECYVFANDNGIVLNVEEAYDDFVPNGSIIAQSVKVDEKVNKGDEIVLTVSKGKKITIPSFSGYSKDKAMAVAGELGIPVTIKEKYSSSSAGRLISQSIDAGSVLDEGDFLELSYSIGNKIILSSFVGQTRDAIESWAKDLNEQGARISISATYTQSNSAKDTIIQQNVANISIGIKTTINITVSLGKAIFVPDFIAPKGSGYDLAITREKALIMCEALNIVPVFVEESLANRLPGEIWYQSIDAGTEVTEESTITLKFTPANVKTAVPNFINMTKAQVLAGNFYKALDITFEDVEAHVEGYDDTVYEQSIAANTTVVAGSPIILYISPLA